ncbi:ABC transporter ATP-binding protein [Hoeflea sp. YIM 152468]|uniref:ABC transporter ATP-binding protein n=1 Tax=Hoeflea sp. YIM 152468 TaxID=3031759 RepID=UPI0023DAEBEB|nr:ABC transporter ATP-binding protein [Hoeflea sp. YIM 152468]MDF1609269.1 ABC transporter ATP-binding protein [Hoeflea sp. YIM 152468]
MQSITENDLECIQIQKHFGSVRAVDNVSFEIPKGSFFSILGPSGCGKTTLMRMIAGFEQPSSGDIRIKGNSVIGTPPNRRNVKMVFQHLALFPMMNVYENIAYGLRCAGASKDVIRTKVHDVLERISLPDVANREITQLSGGQKQRIAIARCMVLDPDVLLLDEPLGALDLKLREAMKIELKLLQHQFDTTFVYITHDQSEALVMSDNVAIMNEGKFVQIGTPQELYHNPTAAFVAGFVGDTNRWAGRVIRAENGTVEVETEAGLTMRGSVRGSGAPGVGDTVSAFVRPEFITAEKTTGQPKVADQTHNVISGKIDSILFNGANSRALVRDRAGELIEADVVLTGGTQDLKPKDDVTLSWSCEQTMSFKG